MMEALRQALRQRGLTDEEIEAILQEAEFTEKVKSMTAKLVGNLVALLQGGFKLEVYQAIDNGRFDWVLATNDKEWRGSIVISNNGDNGSDTGNGNTGGRKLFTEEDLNRLARLLGKQVTEGTRRYLAVYVVNWTKEALKAGLLSEDDELVARAKQSRQW